MCTLQIVILQYFYSKSEFKTNQYLERKELCTKELYLLHGKTIMINICLIFFHLFRNVSTTKIMVNDMLHFILKPSCINIGIFLNL